MQDVVLRRSALGAVLLFVALCVMPAAGQSLFTRHNVSVEFATADGKPIADAEVRVFAPGRPSAPVLTGRTDKSGKFEFAADVDGMWTAEARSDGEVARVAVRVGGQGAGQSQISPYWLIGGLFLLLVLAFAYRIARARAVARRPPGG